MRELINHRATYVFVALIALTGVGYLATGLPESESTIWAQVVFLACVKVRWVLLDFMELRAAPVRLRLVFEGWVLLMGGALIAINWLG
ncbi:cytochrome C oxidase subunit IV family protein [Mycobacterium deserti]|uniref:Cytochrome C oxidase subunit IV family protein n=1 Tax=Mycobacterium deserti TaxID=2978347 RepID=A0ABT2M4J9_9MYCO|nr:cytochrome C oxidase subunit IV family protein [Mycobacterium deserti]MCT7657185.1 cytochrome C oxidase subunit IV family protein [Mycobacterium deserti]